MVEKAGSLPQAQQAEAAEERVTQPRERMQPAVLLVQEEQSTVETVEMARQ